MTPYNTSSFFLAPITKLILGCFFSVSVSSLISADSTVFFIGHTTPDTDSIVSSIGAAHFFDGVPARTGQINKETQYLLEKAHLPTPSLLSDCNTAMVALVDFNQKTQAPEGLNSANIYKIIDHHALGDASFTFDKPIYITIKPWGSTSTIVADLYFQETKAMPQAIALVLLGGIISDTLNFSSPTTTKKDYEIAQKLQQIAGVLNCDDLAKEMFEAKSAVGDLTAEQLLQSDYKEYDVKGHRIAIGVIETTTPDKIVAKKDSLLDAMRHQKAIKKLDFIFLNITDITCQNSTLIVLGDEETKLAENCFKSKAYNNLILLPGIVSRKAQLIPMITKALE